MKSVKKIYDFSSGKISLILLIILVLMLFICNSSRNPFSSSSLSKISQGESTLDWRIIYSSDDIYQYFYKLGEKGRVQYAFGLLVFDFFLPFIAALFGMTCITYFFKKIISNQSKINYLIFIPIGTLFSDYSENIIILMLIKTYPEKLHILSNIPVIFSVSKSFFGLISIFIIVFSLIILVYRYIIKK